MKKICLCFQLHQPYRLRRYRFFDIGNEHYYSDDFLNEEVFDRIADTSYLPANRLMLELLEQYSDLCVSYSISGLVIEQMEYYKPELIDSFRSLVATGRVELLAETYAHSLVSLYDEVEFRNQVRMQQDKLHELLGATPSRILCNTEFIYSDDMVPQLKSMGIDAVITEGAKHVLGWKSPSYLYHSALDKDLKILMRHGGLSDLISKDFTNYSSPSYPITADGFVRRLQSMPQEEEFYLLQLNYEVLGSIHSKASGIFEFFRALPHFAQEAGIGFATPSQLVEQLDTMGAISVSSPISISGEEKSINEWMGNTLQTGAIDKLREWGDRVRTVEDRALLQDWLYLQSSDHFYYMNTVNWGGGGFSPYSSPYDAFNNYMNVLSDFLLRVEEQSPRSLEIEELDSYQQIIHNQNERIRQLEAELAESKAKCPKPE